MAQHMQCFPYDQLVDSEINLTRFEIGIQSEVLFKSERCCEWYPDMLPQLLTL